MPAAVVVGEEGADRLGDGVGGAEDAGDNAELRVGEGDFLVEDRSADLAGDH